MKCWECKKEISSAWRVRYSVYDEELGYKGKYRNVCDECHLELELDPHYAKYHFVEVKKITGRQIKKEIKSRKKNPYLKPNGSFELIEKFPSYKKKGGYK